MYGYDIFQCIVNQDPIIGYSINKFFHKMLEKSDLNYYRKFIRDNRSKKSKTLYASKDSSSICEHVFENKEGIFYKMEEYREYNENSDEDSGYETIKMFELPYDKYQLTYPSIIQFKNLSSQITNIVINSMCKKNNSKKILTNYIQ